MVELPWIVADFLKVSSIIVFTIFMVFLSIYVGFYLFEFLDTHIIGVE